MTEERWQQAAQIRHVLYGSEYGPYMRVRKVMIG